LLRIYVLPERVYPIATVDILTPPSITNMLLPEVIVPYFALDEVAAKLLTSGTVKSVVNILVVERIGAEVWDLVEVGEAASNGS
jgi:hypothetical protein